MGPHERHDLEANGLTTLLRLVLVLHNGYRGAQMLFSDEEPLPDLLTGDARANFLALMKVASAEVFSDQGA